MKIIIDAEPKEIAALVVAIQERRESDIINHPVVAIQERRESDIINHPVEIMRQAVRKAIDGTD